MPETNVHDYVVHITQGYYLSAGSVRSGVLYGTPISQDLAGCWSTRSLANATAIRDMLSEMGTGSDVEFLRVERLVAVPVNP
jgi:hypothetical protein